MNSSIVYREYDWGSDVYGQALILRNRLLRRPLGMCLYDEALSVEKDFLHFGAFQEGKLIATLLLVPEESAIYRMKQVAVEEPFQRQGIGLGLLQFCEAALQEKGAAGIVLHARKTAELFYVKAGYLPKGTTFTEVGIPHQAMEKRWDHRPS